MIRRGSGIGMMILLLGSIKYKETHFHHHQPISINSLIITFIQVSCETVVCLYYKPNVFRVNSLTVRLYCSLLLLHTFYTKSETPKTRNTEHHKHAIGGGKYRNKKENCRVGNRTQASILAPLSSFGSANMDITLKRIFSTLCTGDHLSELDS